MTERRQPIGWAQATWGLALLVALLSAWFDMRSTQREMLVRLTRLENLARDGLYTRTEIDLMKQSADVEHARLEHRIDRLEGRR